MEFDEIFFLKIFRKSKNQKSDKKIPPIRVKAILTCIGVEESCLATKFLTSSFILDVCFSLRLG